jgi:hypothetical protein
LRRWGSQALTATLPITSTFVAVFVAIFERRGMRRVAVNEVNPTVLSATVVGWGEPQANPSCLQHRPSASHSANVACAWFIV